MSYVVYIYFPPLKCTYLQKYSELHDYRHEKDERLQHLVALNIFLLFQALEKTDETV